jgi:hypothetical protein
MEETAVEVVQGNVDLRSKIQAMEENLAIIREFFSKVMIKGQDYGIIPGTDKPVLLKSGAEKLCELYGFAPSIKEILEEKDRDSGYYRVRIIISLTKKSTGEFVTDGVGEASTWESKYRYRWIPEDELTEEERTGKKSKLIKGRRYYRLENDNLHDLWNTVLKMAKKRALVDAVLTATRSSGLFTQDIEDLEDWIDVEAEIIEEHPEKPEQGKTNGKTTEKAPEKATEKQIHKILELLRGYVKRTQDEDEDAYKRRIEKVFQEKCGKSIYELSKTEASAYIDKLERKKQEAPF